MAPELLPAFRSYSWPGNVRELENTIERMVVLSRGNEIGLADLPDWLRHRDAPAVATRVDPPREGMSLEAVEKDVILQALRKFGGRQTQAARYLGITRRTLAYRLGKYGIETRAFKQASNED
jgi:two-component system NtrC family response regulator